MLAWHVIDSIQTAGDILKARLQTIGMEEHAIVVEEGNHRFPAEVGQTWLFYDVGGSRHQRAAWAPYFDDGKVLPAMLRTVTDGDAL